MPAKNESRIKTGVRNLDALLGGGLPRHSVTIISGPPGSGKTTLAQQFCFHNASPKHRALYFSTLSEPAAKLLRHLTPFEFFDAKKLDAGIEFIDLGSVLIGQGREAASDLIIEHVQRAKPEFIVIDSFKVFDDLAQSDLDRREFSYKLAVDLMAWQTTTLLLGEFGASDVQTNPLFSIVDGQVLMSQRDVYGEQRRFIRIVKMRGTAHSRDEHQFEVGSQGIEIFAPRLTIQREDRGTVPKRLKTGLSKLDDLLGQGIPRGSSLLIAGVAGTGKTALLLDFIYTGAKMGEKGLFFSFEETEERLIAAANGFGWDLEAELKRGMVEIVFIPQPDIMIEADIVMMQDRVQAMGAKRIAIDSISVFMHKIRDPQVAREKTFQLASIVQNAQAVGFFATDIAYGTSLISRFGVEETVVDGVLVLTSTEEGLERQRYIEIYKLRNTAHLKGRHSMVIDPHGIEIYPRYAADTSPALPLPPMESKRLASGVEGLDDLLMGGYLERSVTLVSGSAGAGKSILGMQFIDAGLALDEPGLYVSFEEGPEQVLRTAKGFGLPWAKAEKSGLVELSYLSPGNVRSSQFLAILEAKIKKQKTRRLVLDGVAHMTNDALPLEDLRELLIVLVAMFKQFDVTTILTLESTSMYSTDQITDSSFSAVSDNLLALRYEIAPGELRPYLIVVKTRGSDHDRGTYQMTIGKQGMRIGERVDLTPEPVRKPRPASGTIE